jgi:hypothetical protein
VQLVWIVAKCDIESTAEKAKKKRMIRCGRRDTPKT